MGVKSCRSSLGSSSKSPRPSTSKQETPPERRHGTSPSEGIRDGGSASGQSAPSKADGDVSVKYKLRQGASAPSHGRRQSARVTAKRLNWAADEIGSPSISTASSPASQPGQLSFGSSQEKAIATSKRKLVPLSRRLASDSDLDQPSRSPVLPRSRRNSREERVSSQTSAGSSSVVLMEDWDSPDEREATEAEKGGEKTREQETMQKPSQATNRG